VLSAGVTGGRGRPPPQPFYDAGLSPL